MFHNPRRCPQIGIAVLIVLLAAGACSPFTSSTPKIRVENVWSRPAASGGPATPPQMSAMGSADVMSPTVQSQMPGMGSSGNASGSDSAPGVVYMDLINEGGTPDRLIEVEADAASRAELHESTVENGIARMKPISGGIEVPANGKVQLKPRGYHVMLIGLKRDLRLGDRFRVTLQFEKSGVMEIEAEVRQQ